VQHLRHTTSRGLGGGVPRRRRTRVRAIRWDSGRTTSRTRRSAEPTHRRPGQGFANRGCNDHRQELQVVWHSRSRTPHQSPGCSRISGPRGQLSRTSAGEQTRSSTGTTSTRYQRMAASVCRTTSPPAGPWGRRRGPCCTRSLRSPPVTRPTRTSLWSHPSLTGIHRHDRRLKPANQPGRTGRHRRDRCRDDLGRCHRNSRHRGGRLEVPARTVLRGRDPGLPPCPPNRRSSVPATTTRWRPR